MNDTQEMIFGLNEGLNILEEFRNNANVFNQVGGQQNFRFISLSFDLILKHFESKYSKNVYVLCFSEYDEKNHPDGHLSMWRGYGGNGQGVALIFDTKFLKRIKYSPLFFAKVNYATNEEHKDRLKKVYLEIFEIVKRESENKTDLDVDAVLAKSVREMFYFTLQFSLTSKHKGFEEEKEWRMIYIPIFDAQKILTNNQTYLIKNNIIHPKLDFKIKPLDIEEKQNWTFDTILHSILVGPAHNSSLSFEATKQMLTKLGKANLINKLKASTIPYRPQSHA